MFRPTHIVILFAVVLCANALPAALDTPTPLAAEPEKSTEIGESRIPAPELDTHGAGVHGPLDSRPHDLKTDATIHFGYGYYGPRWYRSYAYGPYTYWR